tara:strand:- start:662 stop:781 length:120 start_codon:yes stop_codon:yes gene_type:complete
MLGEEDIPTTITNKIFKNNNYINKVLRTSVVNVNKDKTR